MKITKSQLKQIIKEEIGNILEWSPPGGYMDQAMKSDLQHNLEMSTDPPPRAEITPQMEKDLKAKVYNHLVRLPLNNVYKGMEESLDDLQKNRGFENIDREQLKEIIFTMIEDSDLSPRFRDQYDIQAER